MPRLGIVVCVKLVVWIALVALAFAHGRAHAQGRYLDLSLNGSYAKSLGKSSDTYRRSWGMEVGLPLTSFFNVSLGHTFVEDTTLYSQEYKDALQSKLDYTLPEGRLSARQRIQDYSANGDLGYAFRSVRPSIFGGALRRKVCHEDALEDHGCETQDLTWNGGVALQVYITWSLRFKATYRVSPSVRQPEGRRNKLFDELTSLGLQWSL